LLSEFSAFHPAAHLLAITRELLFRLQVWRLQLFASAISGCRLIGRDMSPLDFEFGMKNLCAAHAQNNGRIPHGSKVRKITPASVTCLNTSHIEFRAGAKQQVALLTRPRAMPHQTTTSISDL
jgi:hypothetical protein